MTVLNKALETHRNDIKCIELLLKNAAAQFFYKCIRRPWMTLLQNGASQPVVVLLSRDQLRSWNLRHGLMTGNVIWCPLE